MIFVYFRSVDEDTGYDESVSTLVLVFSYLSVISVSLNITIFESLGPWAPGVNKHFISPTYERQTD